MKRFLCGIAAMVTGAVLLGATAASPVTSDAVALMKAQNAPGMEIVVVEGGKIVTDAAYGVKNLASQAPVDVHTRFEIGSITKQVTAAAILQLKEQGKLSLDDPLGKYVPEYAQGKAITIRQLLLQVSGIPNYTDMKSFTGMIAERDGEVVITKRGSFEAILAMLEDKPLDFATGTKWAYSNSNYAMLGRIVEIASGMPWDRYVAKHIFAPAGMTESAFMSDEGQIADMATGYVTYKGALQPAGNFDSWAGSDGAIVSTASDVAKWDAALFGGKLIDAADLHEMTAPGPLPAGSPGLHYGYGWMVDRFDGQNRVWHNGGTLGFNAANHVYPALGQEIIVLLNTGDGNADAVAAATFDRRNPQLAASKTTAVPGEDPVVTARAKALWAQFVAGSIDRSQFDDAANKALTPDVLAAAKAQFSQLGSLTSWVFRGKRVVGDQTGYAYYVTFSSGVSLVIRMTVGKDGKVSGYLATPN